MHQLTETSTRLHAAEHRGKEQIDTREPDEESKHHQRQNAHPPDIFPTECQQTHQQFRHTHTNGTRHIPAVQPLGHIEVDVLARLHRKGLDTDDLKQARCDKDNAKTRPQPVCKLLIVFHHSSNNILTILSPLLFFLRIFSQSPHF